MRAIFSIIAQSSPRLKEPSGWFDSKTLLITGSKPVKTHQNKPMKTRIKTLATVAFSGMLLSISHAQVIFSDNFDGSFGGGGGAGTPPTSWTNFNPYGGANTNLGANASGLIGGNTNQLASSPQGGDFVFAFGNQVWQADLNHFNNNGGQYLWNPSPFSTLQMGGFSRSISGFTPGETYTISWEQQNIGWDPLIATVDFVDRSAWAVFVDGAYLDNGGFMAPGTVPGFSPSFNPDPLAQEAVAGTSSYFTDVVPWNATSVTFTATSSSHTIGFANVFAPQFDSNYLPYEAPYGPNDVPLNPALGDIDANFRSMTTFDNLVVAQVPEPSGALLVAVTALGAMLSRRRR